MNALKTFFFSPFAATPGRAVTKPVVTNYVEQELARRAGLEVFEADGALMSLLNIAEDDDDLLPTSVEALESADDESVMMRKNMFINQFTGRVDPTCTGGLADPFGSMG